MSLIKKIKQFINGSWQEFKLDANNIDNVATQEWVTGQEYAKTSTEAMGEEFQPVSVDWADLIGKDLSGSTLYFDTTKSYGAGATVSVSALITTSNGYTLEIGGPPDFYLAKSGNQIATFYLYSSSSWPYSEYTLPADFGTIVSAGGNAPADSCIRVLNAYCPTVSLKVEKKVTKLHAQDVTLIVPQENDATIATQEWANMNLSSQIKWSQDLIDQKKDLSGWTLKFDTNTYYGNENIPGQTWYLAATYIYSSNNYILSIGGPPNIQLYQKDTFLFLIWQYLSTNSPGIWQMSELTLPEDFGYITSIETTIPNYFDALNIMCPKGFNNDSYAKLNGANTFSIGTNKITLDPSSPDAIHFVGGIGGDDTAYGMKFESAMRYSDATTYGMGGITIDRFQDYGGQIKHTTKIEFPESSDSLPSSSTTTTLTLPNASGALATQEWVEDKFNNKLKWSEELITTKKDLSGATIKFDTTAGRDAFTIFSVALLTSITGYTLYVYAGEPSDPYRFELRKNDIVNTVIYNESTTGWLVDSITLPSDFGYITSFGVSSLPNIVAKSIETLNNIAPNGVSEEIIATKEWVQAQGYGSGSSDTAPAVYSPIETTAGNTFTFDNSMIKTGHLYKVIIQNGSLMVDGNNSVSGRIGGSADILMTVGGSDMGVDSIVVPIYAMTIHMSGTTVIETRLPNAYMSLTCNHMTSTEHRLTVSLYSGDSSYTIKVNPSNIKLVEVR